MVIAHAQHNNLGAFRLRQIDRARQRFMVVEIVGQAGQNNRLAFQFDGMLVQIGLHDRQRGLRRPAFLRIARRTDFPHHVNQRAVAEDEDFVRIGRGLVAVNMPG